MRKYATFKAGRYDAIRAQPRTLRIRDTLPLRERLRKHYKPAIAILISTVAALLVVRPVLALPYAPSFRHDWIWPIADASLKNVVQIAFSAWAPQDLGSPNSYPSLAPIFVYMAWGGKLFGLKPSLDIFLVFCATAAALGALVTGRALFNSTVAGSLSAIAYVGSPGFTNELIAGHYGDLMAYAAFPWMIYALVGQYRRPAPLWIVLACAAAALCTLEIQFTVFNLGVLTIAALVMRRRSVTIAAMCSACFMLLVNATTIGQALRFGTEFGVFLRQRAVLSWIHSQSAPFPLALYGAGYGPHYDRLLLTGPASWINAGANVAIVLALVACACRFRRDRAVVTLVAVYGAGVAILSGERGPLGFLFAWLFVHVRTMSLLRELYHVSQLVTLPLGLGLGGVAVLALALRESKLRIAILACVSVVTVAYASGPLAGGAGHFLRAHPLQAIEREGLDRSGQIPPTERLVFWPGQQPVETENGDIGVDPLAYYPVGDNWSIFSYDKGDVTTLAADLLYRGRFADAQHLYARMSVGFIVLSRDRGFAQPNIVLERERIRLAVSPPAYAVVTSRIQPVDALPLVRGSGTPIVVDGDFARLLDRRYAGEVLAFMRQRPPFLAMHAEYRLGDSNPIDAAIAFGCRSVTVPEPSALEAGVRSAWVAGYRYGYADPSLAMPLTDAVVTQSDVLARSPQAADGPELSSVIDGSGRNAFAWVNSLPALGASQAIAVAAIAGPPKPNCVAAFQPTRTAGRVAVLNFRRESPTALDGTLSIFRGGTLAFSDSFNPGWKLEIDGEPTDERLHFLADGFANGWVVQAKPGVHRFNLRYEPQGFFDAMTAIALFAWIALAATAIICSLRAVTRRIE